jgi:adenylate kinase
VKPSRRIVLLGPPGSGKGTQASDLARLLGVPAISTGEILRAEVRSGSELGRAAERTMAAGAFVADALVDAIVETRLRLDDARVGFVLDGYPRTVAQVTALDAALARNNARVEAAIALDVDEAELTQRLLGRASLEGRADDEAGAIPVRLAEYDRATVPVLSIYARRGILVNVDGKGERPKVGARLRAVLGL